MEMSSTFPKMIRLLVNERTLLLISSRTSHDHAWSLHGQACQRRSLKYEGLHLLRGLQGLRSVVLARKTCRDGLRVEKRVLLVHPSGLRVSQTNIQLDIGRTIPLVGR